VHPERRRGPRYPVDLEIRVDEGTAIARNLGGGGVYFETERLLSPGEEVVLVFPFEHAAPSGTLARCSARVLRVEKRVMGYGVAVTCEAVVFEMP
jgi:hypothetical protein